MKCTLTFVLFCGTIAFCSMLSAQTSVEFVGDEMPRPFTPRDLIQLNRVSGLEVTADGQFVITAVSQVSIRQNKKETTYYKVPVKGGVVNLIENVDNVLTDSDLSPDGKHRIVIKGEHVKNMKSADLYPHLPQSNMYVFDDLNYRHWDTWEDGRYNHVVIEAVDGGPSVDIMKGEPYDCPQQPFGGSEDYTWSPDGKSILYVCKKKFGTEYAKSTNTDIYQYDLKSGRTTNLTEGNPGYDTQPSFSSKGQLAWLQMRRDGYESDKNDIMVRVDGAPVNLTKDWDGTVNSFRWSNDGSRIYFTAPTNGTVQLFEIAIPAANTPREEESGFRMNSPHQLTEGQFDIRGIVGEANGSIILSRGDMLQASELYSLNLNNRQMQQITAFNDYAVFKPCEVKKRMVQTTDGKDMVCWVIYPPDFDPSKKYPTLLYCQGGPQGALSQFYSYRWNFHLMASQGYIVIAPNRRGMPGYGVEWNEQISRDYGGQNMQDYLVAIDDIAKESYVDNSRLGCLGASYGGYSAFYLAAIHEGRFKSFIAHDGIFNWKSMYGTTEEMFFVNWDLGGPYWQEKNAAAQKSYTAFNPVEHVGRWDTPILIIQGGKDYRVPIGQGLEAFQAAQLRGIKSRLLYFPEENHWVLDYQNSLIWHQELYKWLDETLHGE